MHLQRGKKKKKKWSRGNIEGCCAEEKGLSGGFGRGDFYSDASIQVSVNSIFKVSVWHSYVSGHGREGNLENDLLLVTTAQDEAFTCCEFVVSNMQAAYVGVHAISDLFLGGRIAHSLSPTVQIPVLSPRSCVCLD